jgi:hypothetical protein
MKLFILFIHSAVSKLFKHTVFTAKRVEGDSLTRLGRGGFIIYSRYNVLDIAALYFF